MLKATTLPTKFGGSKNDGGAKKIKLTREKNTVFHCRALNIIMVDVICSCVLSHSEKTTPKSIHINKKYTAVCSLVDELWCKSATNSKRSSLKVGDRRCGIVLIRLNGQTKRRSQSYTDL